MTIRLRPILAAALLTIAAGSSAHYMPAPVVSIDATTNIMTWAPVPGAVNYEIQIDGVTTSKIGRGAPLVFDASALPANTSVSVRAIGQRNSPPRSDPGAVLVVDQGPATDPTVTISIVTGDGVYSDAERAAGITISGTTSGLIAAREIAVNAAGRGYTATSDPAVNDGDWSLDVPAAHVADWPETVQISAYVETPAGLSALASAEVVYRATQTGGGKTPGDPADGWVAGAVHPATALPLIVADADFDGGQAIQFSTTGGVLERFDYQPAGGFGTGNQFGFDVKMPTAGDTYLWYINVTNAAGSPYELNITNRAAGARFVSGDAVFFIDPARSAGVRKREVVNLATMMASRGGLGTIESIYLRTATGARMDRIGRTTGEPLTPSFAPPAVPSAPGSLRYTELGETSVTLAWNASTDDDGSIERYIVRQDGVEIASTAGLSIEITGLTTDTTYVYAVSAIDDGDNEGDQSASLSVTPSATPPVSTDGMANIAPDGTLDNEIKAFPGAMGVGRYTRGGRTAGAVHLTVGSNAELNAAMADSRPKIISFSRGGVYTPSSSDNFYYPNSNTTILCSTAPAPGVVLAADNFTFKRHSQLLMRGCIHAGDDVTKARDGMRGFTVSNSATDVMLDHGDYLWGGDENWVAYANTSSSEGNIRRVTMQNFVAAEGDVDSSHNESKTKAAWAYHAQGPNCNSNNTVAYVECSLLYGLIAHSAGRNPACMGGICEFVGLITYNGHNDNIQTQPHQRNSSETYYHNNLIKRGPNFGTLSNISSGTSKMHAGGNYLVGIGQSLSSAAAWNLNRTESLPSLTPTAPIIADIKTLAQDANYLACLGAFPHRSATVNRIIGEMQATGSFGSGGWNQSASSTAGGTIGVGPNTVPSGWWTFSGSARANLGTHDVTNQRGPEYTANGWNSSATLSGDTDGDTIPDVWETANGMNPASASDALGDVDGDGYYNIEEYASYLLRCPGGY